MRTTNKLIAAGLLLIGLIIVNMIASWFPMQKDFTEEQLYTLSPGSISLLEQLEEPITITLYFSRSNEGIPIYFKNYASQVEDLLRQYERSSDGLIEVKVIDPKPDTDEEMLALRTGVRGQPMQTGGYLFFGLHATQADQEKIIPIFAQNREKFLEYDISQLIFQVQQIDQPKVGIITGIPDMFGSAPQYPGAPQANNAPPWYLIESLRKTYDVEQVSGNTLPDDLDALVVIFADAISEEMKFSIDQFLLSGKPVLLAEDSSFFIHRMRQSQAMMGRPPMAPPSQFENILSKWGVNYDFGSVTGDLKLATTLSLQRGKPPTSKPFWLTFREFDKDSIITSQLNDVMMAEPSSFSLNEDSDLKLIPLLKCSKKSSSIPAQILAYMPSDQQLAKQIRPDNKERTVAGIIRGKFKSAFPDGKPKPEGDEAEKDAKPEEEPTNALTESSRSSTLVLICDVDFMTDDLSVQRMNMFGPTAIPTNSNIAFVVNIIDSISGSEDLISLRSKGSSTRPFTRLENMQRDAQVKFQKKMDSLEKRLQDVRGQINKLRGEQQNQQSLVASPEVIKAIKEFSIQEANLKKERRSISKELREDIEALDLKLAMLNLLAIPALYAIGSILLFTKRNKRKKN